MASPPSRWNGANTRSRSASGMPAPASMTSSTARAPRRAELDAHRRLAVAPGVLQQVADQPPQQPRIAADRHRLALQRAVVVARAFLGGERQQVDVLARLQRADRRRAGSPAGFRRSAGRARRCRARARPCISDRRSRWNSSMPSRMRDSGVRSSCEALASSRRCASDQFLDAGGRAVEALGEPRHLVAALDLDARRQVAGAERLDAGLQALQPARQPAHHRIGAEPPPPARCRRATAPGRCAGWRCRTGARATTSGRPAGGSSRPAPPGP